MYESPHVQADSSTSNVLLSDLDERDLESLAEEFNEQSIGGARSPSTFKAG